MSNVDLNSHGEHHTLLTPQEHKRNPKLLSVGVLRIQFLFDIQKLSTKLIIVALVSVFLGTYNFFILERTGLYSLGINSIFQSIARCVSYFLKKGGNVASAKALHSILFWGMTLFLNIPLAFLGYKKVGKKFTILTIFSICVSTLTSISFSSFPESWGLKNFYIFSDPRTFNSCLTNEGINILQWNYVSVIKPNGNGGENIFLNDNSKLALIFFYGFVFGLLNTVSSLIIYSLGGSTGGMDWLVFYMFKKTNKSISNISLYLALIISFVAYLLGTFVPYVDHQSGHSCSGETEAVKAINAQYHSTFSNLLGPIFIATTIAAFTKRILFSLFFPQLKLINVRIFTNKVTELRSTLLSSDFPHSFTITSSVGGYLLRKQIVFEITCFALELKTIREHVSKIDPGCLIIATPIKSLSGKMTVMDRFN